MGATPDPRLLLALAVDAAHEAGELLLRRPADLGVGTKSSPTDVVTVMDTAAERLIRGRVLAARPDDAILGEEGSDDAGTSGVRWVVDPLDGTVNYLYGLPQWAVSIGVEVDGVVVAGVVHDPSKRETWTAVRGEGAWLDGDRLQVSGCRELSQALVATGFGYEVAERVRQGTIVADLIGRVRDIRRLGAASLDLCSLAAGRVDGYFERGLNPWDLAAGGLLASEAGAVVGGLVGVPAGKNLVVAAGPALFPLLHDALAPWRPDLGPAAEG